MSASRIKTLIVDDEAPARSYLRALAAADPEIELLGECADGLTALEAIRTGEPALVLLDVQMPGMSGLEVVEALGPERAPVIVFVTAYSSYAVRAFEVSALDYLVKPFDDGRFLRALERAKRRVREGRARELATQLASLLDTARAGMPGGGPGARTSAPGGAYLERLAVPTSRGVTFVEVDDVDWIEAEDYYVEVHAGGRGHLLRQPLKDLEARLDPRRFVRIHRSVIVNRARVKELQPASHGDYVVLLADGTRLRMSRSHRERLRDLF